MRLRRRSPPAARGRHAVPERRGRGGHAAPVASVSVLRSGGVAGLLRRRAIDAASLSAEQKAALVALVEAPPKPPPRGADRFSYAVTITFADGTEREVTVPEDGVPPALADILR